MSELPAGWARRPITDTAALIRGVTYNKTQSSDTPLPGYVPILRANNIQAGKLNTSDLVYVPEDCVTPQQIVRSGDIVVAMSSGSKSVVGKAARSDSDWTGAFGAFCGVLRPSTEIDARYLHFFTQGAEYRTRVSELSAGVNINNLKPAHFEVIDIPVAPLAEQTRIAQKLDELLAQVDTIKARIDAIPALLKRFRQSVLAAAVSGRLTEEWRTANASADNGWGMIRIDQATKEERYSLAIGPFGSNLKVSDYRDEGKPLVFVREIRAERFGDEKTKFITPEKFAELSAHQISAGDILITKMGDPPGDVAIYPESAPDAVITADCIKLRINESIISRKFAYFQMKSELFRQKIQEISAGVAQQKVSLGNFRELDLLVPSLQEQAEIVRRVEQLFAFADQLEAKVATAQARIDRLTQSILAKAFRGELVPQDPNDEPASLLLERIQAQRAAAPKAKRGRKSA
ncbi:restriction endonuclease subunit S [Pseudomonas alcaligenes]|uniref:restriction endonuclease subunit S n=1 Tax=Aquipseudomonas alcaligenes TaxID=43263 RepID=UPI00358F11DE